jgi:hypothetical protein
MDPGPVELKAMMATLSLSNDWVDDSAWKYYAEKYKSMREKGPICEFHQEKELVPMPRQTRSRQVLGEQGKGPQEVPVESSMYEEQSDLVLPKGTDRPRGVAQRPADRTFEGEGEGTGFPKQPVRP